MLCTSVATQDTGSTWYGAGCPGGCSAIAPLVPWVWGMKLRATSGFCGMALRLQEAAVEWRRLPTVLGLGTCTASLAADTMAPRPSGCPACLALPPPCSRVTDGPPSGLGTWHGPPLGLPPVHLSMPHAEPNSPAPHGPLIPPGVPQQQVPWDVSVLSPHDCRGCREGGWEAGCLWGWCGPGSN